MLDDPSAIVAADDGRLLALSNAGATVRTVEREWQRTAAVHSDDLGICIVLVGEGLDAAYGDALAELSVDLGVPAAIQRVALAGGDQLPRTADLVVVVSANGLERRMVDAVHVAASRGSEVVVVAPGGSPLAAVAAERRALLVAHDLAADETDRVWWTAYAAVAAVLLGPSALTALADALDEAAVELGPIVESYRNPAKQVAEAPEPLLMVVVDSASQVIATVLAAELVSPGRAVRLVDARRGLRELYEEASRSGKSAQDIFYDPLIDPSTDAPERWRLLLVPHSDVALAAQVRELVEKIGPVLSPAVGDVTNRWWRAQGVLLAQLSGAYRALAER